MLIDVDRFAPTVELWHTNESFPKPNIHDDAHCG